MNESPPQAEEVQQPGEAEYPDSDGRLMADNTLQYQWIVVVQENLDRLLPEHFVAGDLLWYPVEGAPKIRMAPDVMVVLGRPKGHRGSYQQWKEEGIAPQVVFEILSPGNRKAEMEEKLAFYQQYGVSEYYVIDPQKGTMEYALRRGGLLVSQSLKRALKSPLLGIRFVLSKGQLTLLDPEGRPFESASEIYNRAEEERRQKEEALLREASERRQKEEALLREASERRQKEEEQRQKEEALRREASERRQKEEERHQKEAALARMATLEAELQALRDRRR